MAGDQTPQRPDGPGRYPSGAGQAWTAMGYLIAGVLVWGSIGWMIDRWLGAGGIVTVVGVLVGAAGGIYLIFRRLGA